ncbi:MAG: hypothetical protein R3314_04165 [Longimicrobiales bacterium]|nr:hypothetical protein [Longimicrobiales bacterium]
MGVFQELRERRLVQIVLSYLAAGWVFLEVMDQFADRNVLPEVAYYVALVWFLVGIPAAVLVGWHHGEKGQQTAPRSEVVTLSLLAIVALGLSAFTVMRFTTPELDLADYGPNPNRIAVPYFEDRTRENQHIAAGLTESLIEQLASVPALDVVSRNGVARFRGTDVSRDSIAAALDAGTLVGGVLEPEGERLRVTLQLYDASGAPLPDGRVTLEPRRPDSLLQVIPEIGEEASRLLRSKLGDQIQLARGSAETNLTAWTLVQRAEQLRRQGDDRANHGDLHGAFDRFEEAHQLLADAQEADTLWARPTIVRSEIEYRKSRLTGSQPLEAARHADRGIAFADQALEIDPGNPDALASRGTLRYWKYLLNVAHDDREQQQLLEGGKEDLERATRRDPTLASAHSVLSHLYFNTESITRGILAAQRAYDADAYLDAADGILWRLYSGNADVENWTEARKWCEIGRERFPDDPGFVNCPLDLMIAEAMEPDPERAWEIAARVEQVAEPALKDYERINALLSVAGVLASAGLQDSARAVIDRAARQISSETDVANDLRWVEAQMRVMAGQEDEAIEILSRLIAADPDHAFGRGAEIGWMWRPLVDHPRFPELQRADH